MINSLGQGHHHQRFLTNLKLLSNLSVQGPILGGNSINIFCFLYERVNFGTISSIPGGVTYDLEIYFRRTAVVTFLSASPSEWWPSQRVGYRLAQS